MLFPVRYLHFHAVYMLIASVIHTFNIKVVTKISCSVMILKLLSVYLF